MPGRRGSCSVTLVLGRQRNAFYSGTTQTCKRYAHTRTATMLGITVLIVILTCLVYPKVVAFFAIDSCLYQGGRWDHKNGVCDEGLESQKSVSRQPSSGV